MAQRDPLVEYQREGFDMFGAMMDGIKEESVGFLFNLEVQVEGSDDQAQPPDDVVVDGSVPQLDESLLEAAEQEHARVAPPPDQVSSDAGEDSDDEPSTGKHAAPHVSAKGLDRDAPARPLVYSAPTLGSDTPEVRVTGGDGAAEESKTAKRQQQSRSNPNRGSRGNRGTNARRRKK
jgi:preprotein translocase subunit SecA